jgi:hypothetical protein
MARTSGLLIPMPNATVDGLHSVTINYMIRGEYHWEMMAIFTCCYNYVDAAQGEIHQHIVQMTAAKTR